MTEAVTIERLEKAIKITARSMVDHPDLAEMILPHLKRLQAECDRLNREGDPLEYARRVLAA